MKTSMPEKFKHSTPIEIRFVDVDAFGHVNNAHYLTYIEQARVKYFDDIVHWNYDWSKQGIILAHAEINYLVPVLFRDQITVYTRCSRIGTKSFDLEYRMIKRNAEIEILLADAKTVMVAFDYTLNKSIPVPVDWRDAINKFEGNDT